MAELAERATARVVERTGSRRSATTWWSAFRAWPIAKQFLLLILIAYVAKEGLAVVVFPPFSGHDEVAHFAYIETVATQHRVPVVIDLKTFQSEYAAGKTITGDFLPQSLYPYCHYVLDWFCSIYPGSTWLNNPPKIVVFGTNYYPTGWQYAANHPPLYYLLMAPIYKLTEHKSPAFQEHVIRVAAIPFGMVVVIFAYLLAGLLFPGDLFMISTVTALVAFQPQISYEAAMVNNDITSIASLSIMLYLLARAIKYGVTWRLSVLIGATLGIGLLFKSTMLVAIPLILIAVVIGCGWRNYREWIAKGSVSAIVGGLFVWPWYLFLHRTYGNFSALPQVKALQYLWTYVGQPKPTILGQLFNKGFATLRWRETWGEFGWRFIHLHRALLWIIGIPFVVALVGLIIWLVLQIRRRDAFFGVQGGSRQAGASALAPATWQLQIVGLLAVTCAVAYFSILQFGLTFSLTQARYAFPAVNAFAVVSMLGLRTVIPVRWHRYAQALVLFGLLALNVIIFTQYVIPYWYLPS